jgi:hypothetical protein
MDPKKLQMEKNLDCLLQNKYLQLEIKGRIAASLVRLNGSGGYARKNDAFAR